MPYRPLVTFDLFSALIDSRAGGSAALSALGDSRGWPVAGAELYDTWDRFNKASQANERTWIPFAEHSRRAMANTHATHGLDGDPVADAEHLLLSVASWPLWPNVVDGLSSIKDQRRVGVLSNVDNDVFQLTGVAPLIGREDVLTSQLLGCYKPSPEIYRRAARAAGSGLVHVATSARDVRGALEAGITVIRLVRAGHRLDPAGPRPVWEAGDISEVATLLDSPELQAAAM